MTTDSTAGSAARWLSGPDPNGSTDQPGTVAEHHGIDEGWPGRASDAAVDNVIELVHAAIADGVIPLPPGITDIELIRTVDNHYVLNGFLIIADTDTDTGARRCTDTFFADDLTGHETGEAGAITAIHSAAEHILTLASRPPAAPARSAASA